jgi:16S rRNA (cytidine1402-2'-O)-methyltransferase
MNNPANLSGALYIVATPIGNLEDITLRALRVLKEVDLVAAEDTRRTRQLLTHYGIHKPLVSYHEHSRRGREDELLGKLREGKRIALVTDAGTPGISDPGEWLARRAIAAGVPLIPIPGPAAMAAALSVAGLPTEAFLFQGFAPSKAAARRKFLLALRERTETLIFYESPRRLRNFLEDALQVLGDRPVMVARELTKIHEELVRGTISAVLQKIGEAEVRGEVTVVMGGGAEPVKAEPPSIGEALSRAVREKGLTLKEAIDQVAAEFALPRREVYREALQLKGRDSGEETLPSGTE